VVQQVAAMSWVWERAANTNTLELAHRAIDLQVKHGELEAELKELNGGAGAGGQHRCEGCSWVLDVAFVIN
jgi:hypothetical protein